MHKGKGYKMYRAIAPEVVFWIDKNVLVSNCPMTLDGYFSAYWIIAKDDRTEKLVQITKKPLAAKPALAAKEFPSKQTRQGATTGRMAREFLLRDF